MPSALSIPMGMEKYNWRYYTEPEPGLGGRRLHTPRGKVLGGSSSINGMVYVRGNAQDFERWEAEGADGLELRVGAALLPARRDARRGRRRLSRRRRPAADAATARSRIRCTRPGSRPAGRPAIRTTDDINGYQQEGFGRLDMTVGADGRRWSAANAYLRPAMTRPNLAVRTRALATRDPLRGPARDRRRAIARATRIARGARAARSDRLRRADQLAASS